MPLYIYKDFAFVQMGAPEIDLPQEGRFTHTLSGTNESKTFGRIKEGREFRLFQKVAIENLGNFVFACIVSEKIWIDEIWVLCPLQFFPPLNTIERR
jgi:hypothetical protein